MDADALDDALGLIYQTALEGAAWPALLSHLATLFNSRFVDSFHRTLDYSAFGGIAVGLDEADYQNGFLRTWATRNVWGRRRPVRKAGDILTTREMTSLDDLLHSEIYNDYLAPRGLQEGLRLDIRAGAAGIEDISFLRPWKAGAYDAAELRAARLLLPHLQRASLVAERMRQSERLADAGLVALEQLQMAVLLLDRQGRLLHRNQPAAALLQAPDGLRETEAGLAAADLATTRMLQAMLARAGGRSGRAQSGAVRLPRPSGAPSLLLVAMPLHPDQPIPGLEPSRAPAILVCVSDPLARPALCQTQLADLFGLTPAEAALANDLLAGGELRAIAEQSDRSIHTVRSLLARVMAKTETRRQSDLMRLLVRLPDQPRPDEP